MVQCLRCHAQIEQESYSIKFCPFCGWQLDKKASKETDFELGRISALETIKKDIIFWLGIPVLILSILGYFIGNFSMRILIDESVRNEITRISDDLKEMIDIFPVMEHEFYKIENFRLLSRIENDNPKIDLKEYLIKSSKNIYNIISVDFIIRPYLVNENEDIVYSGMFSSSNITIDDLSEIEYLKYDFIISVFYRDIIDREKSEEILNKDINYFISNMKEIFSVKTTLFINDKLLWEDTRKFKKDHIFIVNEERNVFNIPSISFISKEHFKVNVKRDFKNIKKIKMKYRNEVMK
jgi:hypothetical protein